jgi:hypothetical protein
MMTEKVFKENGLKGFYIERDGQSKVIHIVKDCGKRVFSIRGVDAHSRLNKEEREYLFNFIKDLVKEGKIHDAINIHESYEKKFNEVAKYKDISKRTIYVPRGSSKDAFSMVPYPNLTISFVMVDDKIAEINVSTSTVDYDVLKDVLNKKQKYINRFTEFYEKWKELQILSKQLDELDSCKL